MNNPKASIEAINIIMLTPVLTWLHFSDHSPVHKSYHQTVPDALHVLQMFKHGRASNPFQQRLKDPIDYPIGLPGFPGPFPGHVITSLG